MFATASQLTSTPEGAPEVLRSTCAARPWPPALPPGRLSGACVPEPAQEARIRQIAIAKGNALVIGSPGRHAGPHPRKTGCLVKLYPLRFLPQPRGIRPVEGGSPRLYT